VIVYATPTVNWKLGSENLVASLDVDTGASLDVEFSDTSQL
jgi:hypothetical protein